MKVRLYIGLPGDAGLKVAQALSDSRAKLAGEAVVLPTGLGGTGHPLLHIAALDPARVDLVRTKAGYADPVRQAALAELVPAEIAKATADGCETLILAAPTLAGLHEGEVARLYRLLAPLSDEIKIIAHLDAQARIATRHHGMQVLSGRATGLDAELALASAPDWWDAALSATGTGTMAELLTPPHWLDYRRLRQVWEAAFGAGSVHFLPTPDCNQTKAFCRAIEQGFTLPAGSFRAEPQTLHPQPAAQWLARARPVNAGLHKLAAGGRVIGRRLWQRLLAELAVDGDPLDPGMLSALSDRFADDNARLIADFPALAACLNAPAPHPFAEADPGPGFRATQYLAAFLPLIDRATTEAKQAVEAARKATETPLSPSAEKLMPAAARAQIASLAAGRFAPHNRIGTTLDDAITEPYRAISFPQPPKDSSGNLIVACMKNEAPYILEWVAYHRVIGVNAFLIYTNGCEDGTSELLDRLMALGLVEHRDNDEWKGKSPQQAALNKAMKEPVLQKAAWIAHIDVDEFINIRCGDGTLPDFLARVPQATNVAMTWRLFGHNGVERFEDTPVIGQFDTCAPKYAPKPHTVWGFKTLMKNIGAYEKLSCHRPNKLDENKAAQVLWVNGNGKAMGEGIKTQGWRSSIDSIGYDLIQLNHYALRSAESYLVKRQRGRALHVDRSIGLNYWVRMDWSYHRDRTIQRNLPRLRAEMDRMLADPELAKWHQHGVAWHRARADALHENPEFEALYRQALETELTEIERVAFALHLDLES